MTTKPKGRDAIDRRIAKNLAAHNRRVNYSSREEYDLNERLASGEIDGDAADEAINDLYRRKFGAKRHENAFQMAVRELDFDDDEFTVDEDEEEGEDL